MGIEAAITSFIVSAGASAAAAAAIIAVAKFVAVTAVSSLLAKKNAGFDPGMEARTITRRGTVEPQAKVYGETLVAGTLAFLNTAGTKNRELWGVHVLAGHEVESITDIWLDDKVISNSIINGGASAGGNVDSGDFGPYADRTDPAATIYKHYGTSSQAANSAMVSKFSGWTSAHQLRGLAYIVTCFRLFDKTEKVWETGEPTNVRALVKGAKVYDPRLDSTVIIDSTTSPVTYGSGSHRYATPSTWEWSDNPALCVADYLMDSKFSPFPGGIDPTRIDWEAVATAADGCDALVVVPPAASPQNTQKRFTCNGVLYGSATPKDNLEALLSSMNGTLVFSGGKYIIKAGIYEAPVDTLDEDNIIGPIGIRSALDSDERVNTIKASYVDPERSYEPTETAEISIAAYVTRDHGDNLRQEVVLPFTNSWYMAQRICLKRLYEADRQLTLNVPCNMKAARFRPGDRINVNITERSWQPKVFKVLDWDFFDRGGAQIGVNLQLREDDSGAYSDPIVSDYNTRNAAGALVIADPQAIPSVDTIPKGINYGEGYMSCQLRANTNADGSENTGEIQITAGKYFLPDGTVRTISSNAVISTPWDSVADPIIPQPVSAIPPDSTFFIVWGATNPETRFAAGVWGSAVAESAGLFCAVFDRIQQSWYACDNDNNQYSFTPASTDYVVARGGRTGTLSPDPGIEYFSVLVAQLDESGVRNDRVAPTVLGGFENPNPSMQLARVNENGNLCPASWFGADNTGLFGYADDTTREVLKYDFNSDFVTNGAFRVDTDYSYEVVVIARTPSGTDTTLLVQVSELDSELSGGSPYVSYRAISGQSSGEAEVKLRDRGINVIASGSVTLTTTFQVFTATYNPTKTAVWASLEIRSGGLGMEVEFAGLRKRGIYTTTETLSTGPLTLDINDRNRTLICNATSAFTINIGPDCLGKDGGVFTVVLNNTGSISFSATGSPTPTLYGPTSISTQNQTGYVKQLSETEFLITVS